MNTLKNMKQKAEIVKKKQKKNKTKYKLRTRRKKKASLSIPKESHRYKI